MSEFGIGDTPDNSAQRPPDIPGETPVFKRMLRPSSPDNIPNAPDNDRPPAIIPPPHRGQEQQVPDRVEREAAVAPAVGEAATQDKPSEGPTHLDITPFLDKLPKDTEEITRTRETFGRIIRTNRERHGDYAIRDFDNAGLAHVVTVDSTPDTSSRFIATSNDQDPADTRGMQLEVDITNRVYDVIDRYKYYQDDEGRIVRHIGEQTILVDRNAPSKTSIDTAPANTPYGAMPLHKLAATAAHINKAKQSKVVSEAETGLNSVPISLGEALLLEHALARSEPKTERVHDIQTLVLGRLTAPEYSRPTPEEARAGAKDYTHRLRQHIARGLPLTCAVTELDENGIERHLTTEIIPADTPDGAPKVRITTVDATGLAELPDKLDVSMAFAVVKDELWTVTTIQAIRADNKAAGEPILDTARCDLRDSLLLHRFLRRPGFKGYRSE